MGRIHCRRACALVTALALLSSCSETATGPSADSATANTDPAVTTELATVASPDSSQATGPDTSPDTTVRPGGTAATDSSDPVATPTTATESSFPNPVAAGPCALTAAGTTGAITAVVDGQLLELSPDGSSAQCLAELDAEPSGPLQWSPAGDQVLSGGDIVVDADGARATGYFAENRGVRWSYPTGKALVAPAVKDGALVWRDSHDASDRLDISFLAHTDVAVYHPAGKNIIAAGTAADGVEGLFLASNRGANVQPIATLDDTATQIVEIEADVNGSTVYFVHDHGDEMHIHGSSLPSLGLFDVYESSEPVGDLTLSTVMGGSLAFRAGECAGTVRTMVVPGGSGSALDLSSVDANLRLQGAEAMLGQSVSPIGWLAIDQLVVAVRSAGCSGPADVWVLELSPDRLAGRQVLSGTEFVAVRSVVSAFGEMPDDINSQAPG